MSKFFCLAMSKDALNPSRFAQSKKENLSNSNQSEGSNICLEDIFPLNLLREKLAKQSQVSFPD
jgi:hypothetical protein